MFSYSGVRLQVLFLLRHCTAVGLSQVYWLYVTRVNWRCTSARNLVDLRRCGVMFLGNAFSALVSDTEIAAFITQLQWIPHHQGHTSSTDFIFYCEIASAWVAYSCDKKKRCLCKRVWRNKCNYLFHYLTNFMHKIFFTKSFISCLYMFRAHVLETCRGMK